MMTRFPDGVSETFKRLGVQVRAGEGSAQAGCEAGLLVNVTPNEHRRTGWKTETYSYILLLNYLIKEI